MILSSQDVIIPPQKLTNYLLVYKEKNDKSKFLAQVGFTQDNPNDLEAAILTLIREYDAIEDGEDAYGKFYRVEGPLVGLSGTLNVVTVWIMREEEEGIYRFVTLKPKK